MKTLPEEASICAGCCRGVSGSGTDWETSSAGQEEEFKDPADERGYLFDQGYVKNMVLYIVFLSRRGDAYSNGNTSSLKKSYEYWIVVVSEKFK